MEHSKIYGTLSAALAIFISFCAVSCQQEDEFGTAQKGVEGDYVSLQISCTDMLPTFEDPMDKILGTRATTAKSNDEKQIRSLHLFFFDKDGNFVQLQNPDDLINSPYIRLNPGKTEQIVKIPRNCFATTNIYVVALANIQGKDKESDAVFKISTSTVSTSAGAGESYVQTLDVSETKSGYGTFTTVDFEITDKAGTSHLEQLRQWVYAPAERDRVRDLPVGGMPMMSEATEIENTDFTSLKRINMMSMMARVEVNIRLQPNQTSRDGKLPILRVESYGVDNMAATVPYQQPATTDLSYGNIRESKIVEDKHEVAANSTGADQVISLVYYTYENIQGEHEKANPYPAGVTTDAEKQRWKPIVAKDNDLDGKATRIVINGEYTTHQNFTYKAKFSIYLGGNTTTDFSVKRNHCYTNNIVISGLDYVRNDDDGVYTFDGRVNVIDENNVWYMSIVNERKIDSHASVLPMDIYLVLREGTYKGTENLEHPKTSTVTLKIIDEATNDLCEWIGFEMIPYPEVDENGVSMINQKQGDSFVAGTRAKDYFYHNLVSDPVDETGANKFNLRKEGTYTITEDENGTTSSYIVNGETVYNTPGHIEGEESRMRIYFYIDENVPTSANSTTEDVPARHARIEMTYENSNGVKRERKIEIDQSNLYRVHYLHKQNEWTDMYIETTEEYLDHSDPLEYHESTEIFEGLPWGADGYTFSRGILGYPYTDYYHGGLGRTLEAISKLGLDVKDIYLYNLTHGKTADDLWAVTYAYGKNKRQSKLNSGETEGEVYVGEDCVGYWELPGIRDLESALVQYYSTFTDFQGKFYWSSATGKGGLGNNYEVNNKARASRITYSGGDYDYAESNNGDPGDYNRSDRSVRIRAAYKTNAQNSRTNYTTEFQ